jgi:voltage-gated potassium channel Kch
MKTDVNNTFTVYSSWTTVALAFILGIIVTICIYAFFPLTREQIKIGLSIAKGKCCRFSKHILQLIPVFLILVIIYLICLKFQYGDSLLPELIGTGISIAIIDFLIKEREEAEKKNLNYLLINKLDRIHKYIKSIILKYIDFENYESEIINKELLENILAKQNLNQPSICYKIITDEGKLNELTVSKFDYLYYIGRELRPVLSSFMSNYGGALSYKQICQLIKLEEILDKGIFKTRPSTLGNLEGEVYNNYKKAIIETLIELITISKQLRIEGDIYGVK